VSAGKGTILDAQAGAAIVADARPDQAAGDERRRWSRQHTRSMTGRLQGLATGGSRVRQSRQTSVGPRAGV
jgi:hypothetical protein